MKRKIFSVLFAVALALSMSLVTAVPAMAQPASPAPQMEEISPPGVITGNTWSVLTSTVEFVFDFHDAEGDIAYLEFDIYGPSPYDTAPTRIQTMFAPDEANPYQHYDKATKTYTPHTAGELVLFAEMGVSAVYSAAEEKWTITVDTNATWPNPTINPWGQSPGAPVWPAGQYHFYIEVGDLAGNQWGDMMNPGDHLYAQYLYYFHSIQPAIDAATSGDTITVHPGTYIEDFYIDKALTVRSTGGAEETIICGSGVGSSYYMVRIRHSDVTFQGFTVTNPDYASSADASGILVWDYLVESVSNVQILDNIVKEVRSETGIPSMYGATGINIGTGVLSNIVISGNTIQNIQNPEGAPVDHTCGINVWDGTEGVVISNNTISDIKYNGILLQYASDVQIENNTITRCKTGIRVEPCEGATASDVTVNLNNIVGNTDYGVYSDEYVDATNNWWGHASGPSGEYGRTNPDGKVIGKGDAVSANVEWDPWLRMPVRTNPAGKPLPPRK